MSSGNVHRVLGESSFPAASHAVNPLYLDVSVAPAVAPTPSDAVPSMPQPHGTGTQDPDPSFRLMVPNRRDQESWRDRAL